MADIAQLERALIKADAAGNADDARAFANEIRRLRASPQTQPIQPIAQLEQQDHGIPKNIGMGALKGATDIGSTILSLVPGTMPAAERRKQIGEFFNENANPDSWSFKGGELGADIAGTAGVGGGLAKGAMAIPALARFAPALASGGFRIGETGMGALGNAATRLGAGALTGGVTAGMVNPETVGTGAALGGALPIVGAVGGELGRGVKATLYDPIVNQDKIIAKTLLRSIGKDKVDEVAKALSRKAAIPGVNYTAGEASLNPAIAAIEDALRAKNAGGALSIAAQKNRNALASTLTNIGQDDAAFAAAKEARAQVGSDMFGAVRDKMYVGNDDLAKLLARGRADNITREAQKAAIRRGDKFSIPVIEEAQQAGFSNADEAMRAAYGGMPDTGSIVQQAYSGMPEAGNSRLLSEIRKLGGLSTKDMADLIGERATNKSGAQVGVFTKKGEEVGDMVRRLVDRGLMPRQVLNDVDGGAQALRDAIQNQLHGGGDDMVMRAAAEAYYGAPEELKIARETLMKSAAPPIPEEVVVGQAIKGQDLQSIKEGIDAAIGKAKSANDGGAVASLRKLKDEYMTWLGQQDEAFIAANQKYAELSRPINQMQVGRKLADTLIPATSGDAPSRLNAASFARAMRNEDALAKAATGFSGAKMESVMTPAQLKDIRGVLADSSRIAEAGSIGAGAGSPTARRLAVGDYIGQNMASEAPVINSLAELLGNVPGLNYATKGISSAGSMMGRGINTKMANRLEEMLANDPQGTANVLMELTRRQNRAINPNVLNLLRTTPIVLPAISTNP